VTKVKIKNQFRLSIIVFSIVIMLFALLVFTTQQQTAQLNRQAELSLDQQNHASNLVYLSNDYFLYHDNSALVQWQTEFSSLSDSLSKISLSNVEEQALLTKIKGDAHQLNESWTIVALYLENTPLNVTVRNIPVFQAEWSIMSAHNQALIFDATQQSQAFRSQVDQLNFTTILLIFFLLGLFGAYLITNYLITYRNTLKSISGLQKGIAVIGSGNLDYFLKADTKDEIGELSHSFNQMTVNLKTVTASKADLEREVEERKKAEDQLADYSKNLERLVEEGTKQLKDSERLAAIGATAGMVGHDIRNPLQAIVNDVYFAKKELDKMPESKSKESAIESLVEIDRNIDYINKIVQDLQDYAKPLSPQAGEANIQSIISNVISSHRIPEDIAVTINIEKKAQVLEGDPDFIKRIADNLILNAIQAMPNGGNLSVEAKKDKQTGDIILTVEDTGVGIPEIVKSKLFTPMFTTKSKGQGFGLAVVKRMTEALGGNVTFESEHEKGTKFIIRLPPKEINGKMAAK
jgi:signal transduction histidine kinase